MTPEEKRPRPATSRDVAALAGVAQSTVSLVINGGAVAPKTKQRVEEAMRQLRYQPNAGARTLRTSRTRVIALVVHLEAQDDAAETVPYIDSVVEIAREHDYDVLLSTLREGAAGVSRLAMRAICDGFILMDVESQDPRIPVIDELNAPAVLVGRPNEARRLDVVDLDTRRTAELLVDELAVTGHRHIVLLEDHAEDIAAFRHITDFHQSAQSRASGHAMTFTVVRVDQAGWAHSDAIAQSILRNQRDGLGVITRTPRATQGLMNLLQLRGLTPGQDVSVVSRCTDDLATSFAHPVSNVSPQPSAMSRVAMEILFERIAGAPPQGRTVLVEPDGLVRRSTTRNHSA